LQTPTVCFPIIRAIHKPLVNIILYLSDANQFKTAFEDAQEENKKLAGGEAKEEESPKDEEKEEAAAPAAEAESEKKEEEPAVTKE
jgi:hypothetical protein